MISQLKLKIELVDPTIFLKTQIKVSDISISRLTISQYSEKYQKYAKMEDFF